MLALPNFTQPFKIECDASGRRVGGMLIQGGRPITYYNNPLVDSSLSKLVHEKELMTLVLAKEHWRHYIMAGVLWFCLKHLLQK